MEMAITNNLKCNRTNGGLKLKYLSQLLGKSVHKLGDYCIVQNGYAFKSGSFNSEGTPILRIGNISNGLVSVTADTPYFSGNPINKSFRIEKGDTLIAMSGATVGKTGVYNDDVIAYLNQRVGKFVPRDSDKILRSYIKHLVSSGLFQGKLNTLLSVSAQPNISSSDIESLLLPIPCLDAQQQVSTVLDIWDQAIEKLDKLIEAKQKFRKALMQKLLTGQIRFPGFGKPVSNRGDLPEGWESHLIRDIAKEISERNFDNQDHPVILCSKHLGFVNSLQFFNKQVFSRDKSSYKVIKQWQFGFPTNHVEEGSIGLYEDVSTALLSPIYIVFETNKETVYPPYLYLLLKTSTYKHLFSVSTEASVGRRGNLCWTGFAKIAVNLPSLSEQQRVADFARLLSSEIASFIALKGAITTQKEGLMTKFFN